MFTYKRYLFCIACLCFLSVSARAQIDSLYACELCLQQNKIEDGKDSIYRSVQTEFGELLNLENDSLIDERIKQICFRYKFNELARSKIERDSIIEIYSLLRYQEFHVYNYDSFLFELDQLIPEYDSLGAPLVSWKTRIKDNRDKRFIEGELYKLWYETYSPTQGFESWKQNQRDSLVNWNKKIRNFGIYLMGWKEDVPTISDEILRWKLDYYLMEKGTRDFNELKRQFYEEGSKDAYHELTMIYMEVVGGDEKTLELELYAANNYHWCQSFTNAFEFYWLLNEKSSDEGYKDLPVEIRNTMEKLLEKGEEHNCSECSEMLKSIEQSGTPYPK